MIEIVSLIGAIVACIFMIWALYKGLNLPLACTIATVFVALTSGLNVDDAWTTAVSDAVSPLLEVYLGLWLAGGILGYLYGESGAAASLAFAIFRPFKNIQNERVKLVAYLIAFMIIRLLLNLTGVDSMAVMILILSIVVTMFKELDVPRKYVSCVMVCGVSAGIMMPYIPTTLNVILPMFVDGWSASTHGGLRLLWTVAFIVLSSLRLARMIHKDQEKGEHFEMGNMQHVSVEDDPTKRPNALVSLIPIVVVLICYNGLDFSAWLSIACGAVIAAILFVRYLDLRDMTLKGRGKFAMFIEQMNRSSLTIPLYYAIAGIFAGILTISPCYNLIVQLCENMASTLSPAVGFSIVSIVLVFMGNSAVYISAVLGTSVFASAGLSAASVGTIILLGNTVLNTLPNSAEMQMQAEISDTTIAESYPSIFKTTVVLCFVLMIVFVALLALGIAF